MAEPTPDNEATITIGGKKLTIRATNGACKTYADEFAGKLPKPYTGHLVPDLATTDKKVVDCINSAKGSEYFPEWSEMPALTRAIWAMARTAGSTKKSWASFEKALDDAAPNLSEPSVAYNEIVRGDFGKRTFFREI
jgi:hypothetical protein